MNETFLQYKARIYKEFCESYPENKSEFGYNNSDKILLQRWTALILDCARSGETISSYVLDDIDNRGLTGIIYRIRHDWEKSQPTSGRCTFHGTYFTPTERRRLSIND